MRQSLNALFSPETSPHPSDLQPFRLLCDALFFYTLPDANTPLADKNETPKPSIGYTPVQLSDREQDRFHSLAKELRGHEAEFHSGLLASLSAGHADRDEATVGALAASLRSGTSTDRPQQAENEVLWQAMLILKLAEMFREEEREINQGFMAISGKEAELFAAIRGDASGEEEEDEEEGQALRELAASAGPSGPTINMARLTKAWGRRDPRAPEFPLLVTTHEEVQGLLAERYEALTGNPSRLLVSLILPTQKENMADDAQTEALKTAIEAARVHFNRELLGVAASGTISAEQLTALQGAGNELNRASLPFLENRPTEKGLRFYAYEGTTLRDLFTELIGTPTAEPKQGPATTTGLLAVLS
jgi:hypothetical protein